MHRWLANKHQNVWAHLFIYTCAYKCLNWSAADTTYPHPHRVFVPGASNKCFVFCLLAYTRRNSLVCLHIQHSSTCIPRYIYAELSAERSLNHTQRASTNALLLTTAVMPHFFQMYIIESSVGHAPERARRTGCIWRYVHSAPWRGTAGLPLYSGVLFCPDLSCYTACNTDALLLLLLLWSNNRSMSESTMNDTPYISKRRLERRRR